MFRAILVVLLFAPLSACFHQDLLDTFGGNGDDQVDPAIFTPDLSLETDFDELRAKPLIEISTAEDFQALIEKMIPRLISHLNVYNNEADLLASSGVGTAVISPAFKSQSRIYRILSASNCEEVDNSDDPAEEETIDVRNLENKNSLFWDDADDNNITSNDDRWIRLISQCKDEATNRFSTGTIIYTNGANQVEAITGSDPTTSSDTSEGGDTSEDGGTNEDSDTSEASFDINMHDLGVSIRMQIDYDQGPSSSSILFNRMNSLYHRDGETSSRFVVLSGSNSSSVSGEQRYSFDYASGGVFYVNYEDLTTIESITFTGRYYDSELEGFVNIENLNIELDVYAGDTADIVGLTATINKDTDDLHVSLTDDALTFSIAEEENEVLLEDAFSDGVLPFIPME